MRSSSPAAVCTRASRRCNLRAAWRWLDNLASLLLGASVKPENDLLTAASVGLIAMCVVTADHEAFGHGSACLLLHGHITLLTSSLFRCDVRSGWIDPAGPLGNLLGGTVALALARFVPPERAGLRLFLICVTAFSYFWEGGYVVQAMVKKSGDSYFFAQFLLGEVTPWQRWAFAVTGILFYVLAMRLTSRALLRLWPDPSVARKIARIVWLSATLGAGFAALTYRGHDWGNLRDALLEIGLASAPLLFLPGDGRASVELRPAARLERSYVAVTLAFIVFGVFAATLGRGIGTSLAS